MRGGWAADPTYEGFEINIFFNNFIGRSVTSSLACSNNDTSMLYTHAEIRLTRTGDQDHIW